MFNDNKLLMEFRKLAKLAERKHRQHNCNSPATFLQLWILKYLYDNRTKENFQKDIEKVFEIRRATATELINQLEKKELIRRETSTLDKRLKKLVITEKAVELKNEFKNQTKEHQKDIFKGITPEEKEYLIKILHKMQQNLLENS